ncbi:hypothetical protein EGR52_03200 [bacterium]|nr:hypothetical protein [bacterium]
MLIYSYAILIYCMAYFIYKKIKIKQLMKDRNKKFKINDFKKKFKNLKKFQRNQIQKQNKSKGGK